MRYIPPIYLFSNTSHVDMDTAISGLQAKLQTLKKSTSSDSMAKTGKSSITPTSAKETATTTEEQGKFLLCLLNYRDFVNSTQNLFLLTPIANRFKRLIRSLNLIKMYCKYFNLYERTPSLAPNVDHIPLQYLKKARSAVHSNGFRLISSRKF